MTNLLIELWEVQEELLSLQKEIWTMKNPAIYYELIKKNAVKKTFSTILYSMITSELNQRRN